LDTKDIQERKVTKVRQVVVVPDLLEHKDQQVEHKDLKEHKALLEHKDHKEHKALLEHKDFKVSKV
jgi:hypothetical protein